jgi:hypothetical protein
LVCDDGKWTGKGIFEDEGDWDILEHSIPKCAHDFFQTWLSVLTATTLYSRERKSTKMKMKIPVNLAGSHL